MAVAVLAVGLCWWFWPRVDQRFAGRWKVIDEDPDFPIATMLLDLKRDGTGILDWGIGAPEEHVDWRMDGKSLAMLFRFDDPLTRLRVDLLSLVSSLKGDPSLRTRISFTILEETPDGFRVRSSVESNDPSRATFRLIRNE